MFQRSQFCAFGVVSEVPLIRHVLTKGPVCCASTEDRRKGTPECGLGRNPGPQHAAWRNSVCQKARLDRRSLSCSIPSETLQKQKPSGGNSAHSDISNIEDVCLIYRLYLGVFGQLGWGIGVLIKDNIKSYYCPRPTPPHPRPSPHGRHCNTVPILWVKARVWSTNNFRWMESGLIQRRWDPASYIPHALSAGAKGSAGLFRPRPTGEPAYWYCHKILHPDFIH